MTQLALPAPVARGIKEDADLESNWIPAPPQSFSIYIRAYWGEQRILDGSWTPPKVAALD